jgi:hypothetical protein
MTMPLRIEEIFAWIITERDGSQGIPARMDLDQGVWIPLVGADKERIESLRPTAIMLAGDLGLKLELVRFHGSEVLETHDPAKPAPPPSYRCPRCGAVSYNAGDLAHRYCGRCHKFEDQP